MLTSVIYNSQQSFLSGSGEGMLERHRKAISAYTWCVTEKGPQKKWLHFVKKSDTPECHCYGEQAQSGEHLVERCELLTEDWEKVKREDMGAWKSRHIQKQPEKKKKGPVEPEKEKEVDEIESFICHIYEFHFPTPVPAVFVPAALPPRYAIAFLPALPATVPPATVPPVTVPPVTASSVHSFSSVYSVPSVHIASFFFFFLTSITHTHLFGMMRPWPEDRLYKIGLKSQELI